MIPTPYKAKLEQLRQEAAMRAQLMQQYQADMAGRYTKDMIPFAQWLAQRQPGMASGGSASQKAIKGAVVKIGDRLFVGRTHGDALNRAIYEGVVRKQGNKYIYPKDQDVNMDLFIDKDGKLIDRFGAYLNYEIGASETAIDKGLMQNRPASSISVENFQKGNFKASGGAISMAKGGKPPENTVKAYKLFRVHPDHPGKLFPLFVNANKPVEMNKWVDADIGPQTDTGKVKSKLGPLAYRPGWHAGDVPVATHIGEKSDPSITAPDRRPANHAWAEVEMPNDVDWQSEANKRGTNAQGKLVPVKAHITDQIPKGGHYRYKTNPNMTGNWLIGGSMKVNRVLTDKEVEKINRAAGVSDLPRSEPFNKKKFGFKHGGDVTHAHHLEIEERPL